MTESDILRKKTLVLGFLIKMKFFKFYEKSVWTLFDFWREVTATLIIDWNKLLGQKEKREWRSVLRRCNQNGNVSGSNPTTKRSVGFSDPTSLLGSWWPVGRKCKTQWLTSVIEAASWIMAKVGRGQSNST